MIIGYWCPKCGHKRDAKSEEGESNSFCLNCGKVVSSVNIEMSNRDKNDIEWEIILWDDTIINLRSSNANKALNKATKRVPEGKYVKKCSPK